MVSLQSWIGRQEITEDVIEAGLVRRIAATFNEPAPMAGAPLPLLWHWAFFQPTVAKDGLGTDGHPARGGFLPPAENRNRMWAGGRLDFKMPFIVGAPAQRISTILTVTEKQGRTGALLFVTVEHDYRQDGHTVLVEEQDIVYREPTPPKLAPGQPCPTAQWSERVEPDPVLLFRYSAITFNGHRIHYDQPYATGVEGYPGLVVHGPMIATLVLHACCRANPGRTVRQFAFRSQRPLVHPVIFTVAGRETGSGEAEVWAGNDQGIAQIGEVRFS